MNPADEALSVSHAPGPAQGLVPAGFAEKAMASLMQLHGELMEEKERRVDLFRRLMEKEQAVAELRMYVRMLEEKLGVAEPAPPETARAVREPSIHFATARPAPAAPGPAITSPQASSPAVTSPPAAPRMDFSPPSRRAPVTPPRPPAPPVPPRAPPDGWKVW